MPLRTIRTVPTDHVTLAPSILAADFCRLGDEVRAVQAAGAEVIHIDVMDGHFVPNLSMGPAIVRAIRPVSDLPFDVHLMLTDPQKYVLPFVKAGADHVTIHVEIQHDVSAVLRLIRDQGCSCGVSLRPPTPARLLIPSLAEVDLILVMTVEPGFGGQAFRTDVVPKIAEIRDLIRQSGRRIHLQIDGGVAPDTAPQVVNAGANMLVAGTSVFRAAEGMTAAIASMRVPMPEAPAECRPRG